MISDLEVFDSSGLSDEINDDEFTDEEANSQQGDDGRFSFNGSKGYR